MAAAASSRGSCAAWAPASVVFASSREAGGRPADRARPSSRRSTCFTSLPCASRSITVEQALAVGVLVLARRRTRPCTRRSGRGPSRAGACPPWRASGAMPSDERTSSCEEHPLERDDAVADAQAARFSRSGPHVGGDRHQARPPPSPDQQRVDRLARALVGAQVVRPLEVDRVDLVGGHEVVDRDRLAALGPGRRRSPRRSG